MADDDAFMKALNSAACCANCGKTDSFQNLRQCSKCQRASYCSRECQVDHWKNGGHRERCRLNQELKHKAKEEGHKRKHRLLQQWRDNARCSTIIYVIARHFGETRLRQAEEERQIVLLKVEFDYNAQTYLPTQKPMICPTAVLEKDQQEAADQTFNQFFSRHKRSDNVFVLVFLIANNSGSLMPLTIPVSSSASNDELVDWQDIMNVFRRVKLTSSLFATWYPQQQLNLNKQLESLRDHSEFYPFLLAALHVESKKPLHKKRIVVVDLELGFGLGEVKSLKDFEVWPVDKVIRHMEQYFPITEEYKTRHFDLENAPELVESRKRYPNNALVPIVFLGPGACLVWPNMFPVDTSRSSRSAKKCDKAARTSFASLQQVSFPAVPSPAID